jgi:hypothetical protein
MRPGSVTVVIIVLVRVAQVVLLFRMPGRVDQARAITDSIVAAIGGVSTATAAPGRADYASSCQRSERDDKSGS